MILPRVIGILMISSSVAAQAGQAPAIAPQQQTQVQAPAVQKPDKVCHVEMDGNMPRRVCMTKEQSNKQAATINGAQAPGQVSDRNRCLNMGAC